MTATIWVTLILGLGGLVTGLVAAIAKVADWRRDSKKKDTGIQLDEAGYREIASRAAKITSDERIETERWWKEQFDAVKIELTECKEQSREELRESRNELRAERAWRKRIIHRLSVHQAWDDRHYAESPDKFGAPPPLLDDIGDDL